MQKPIRVMIVTRSLMMGGTQRHIVKLCRELAGENVSISVCLLINDEPRDLVQELPEQTNLFFCPYNRHDFRTVFWLAGIVRSEKSQLVHSLSWHADFYSSLLKVLIPGLVLIGSERGDRGAKSFYKAFYNWIDRLIVFKLMDGFCSNSHFGKQLLIEKGCKQKKIRVIPNGVDLPTIDKQPATSLKETFDWPRSTTTCCIVSRLVDYKGIGPFLRRFASSKEDIRIAIVGGGPEEERLKLLVDELSLQDRVVFTGQQYPAIPYIKSSDVCILPTIEDTEHCSNSILEYMACAKPVVAMNVAGNSEIVISGLTGILVETQCVDEIPKILDELALNNKLAEQMGLAGRKRIEESFQMKDIAAKFNDLWRGFVSNDNFQ